MKLKLHSTAVGLLSLLSGTPLALSETLPEANYLTNSGEIWPTGSRTLGSIEDYSAYAPILNSVNTEDGRRNE